MIQGSITKVFCKEKRSKKSKNCFLSPDLALIKKNLHTYNKKRASVKNITTLQRLMQRWYHACPRGSNLSSK